MQTHPAIYCNLTVLEMFNSPQISLSHAAAANLLPNRVPFTPGEAVTRNLGEKSKISIRQFCVSEPATCQGAKLNLTDSQEILPEIDAQADARVDSSDNCLETPICLVGLPVGDHPGFYSCTQTDLSSDSSHASADIRSNLDHSDLDPSDKDSQFSLRTTSSSELGCRQWADISDFEVDASSQNDLSYFKCPSRPSLKVLAGSPMSNQTEYCKSLLDMAEKTAAHVADGSNVDNYRVLSPSGGSEDPLQLIEIEGPGFGDDGAFDKESGEDVTDSADKEDHFWD